MLVQGKCLQSLSPLKILQEAVEDIPQSVSLWPAPPVAAPYVPSVPEPVPVAWVKTGVLPGQSEAPHLVAGLEGVAAKAIQALGKESHGSCSPVVAISPPRSIRRESVVRPRWVVAKKRERHFHVFSASLGVLRCFGSPAMEHCRVSEERSLADQNTLGPRSIENEDTISSVPCCFVVSAI